MIRIFITAFEPYGQWPDNSSWLALVEFTKNLPTDVKVTTRRYPVDFQLVRQRLEHDLSEGFDYSLHLGQAPGSACIRLETVGINLGSDLDHGSHACQPLIENGPVAYRTTLPLGDWAELLRRANIPASVSYHAGTYLCNATLYLALHYIAERRLATQSAFLHFPLDVSQSARSNSETASIPAAVSAHALRLIVDELAKREPPRAPELA